MANEHQFDDLERLPDGLGGLEAEAVGDVLADAEAAESGDDKRRTKLADLAREEAERTAYDPAACGKAIAARLRHELRVDDELFEHAVQRLAAVLTAAARHAYKKSLSERPSQDNEGHSAMAAPAIRPAVTPKVMPKPCRFTPERLIEAAQQRSWLNFPLRSGKKLGDCTRSDLRAEAEFNKNQSEAHRYEQLFMERLIVRIPDEESLLRDCATDADILAIRRDVKE